MTEICFHNHLPLTKYWNKRTTLEHFFEDDDCFVEILLNKINVLVSKLICLEILI